MFGKPEWFREKVWGWGLVPITWQGWAYTAVWVAVMVVPFTGFISFHRWPEAFIWLGATLGGLIWETKKIIDAKHPKPKKDVLYIGDDEDESVKTSKLDMRLRS